MTKSIDELRRKLSPDRKKYDRVYKMLVDLYEVFQEFDGIVTEEHYYAADAFCDAIPDDLPLPSIAAEPDGMYTFEWHVAKRQTLSVSVGVDGFVYYAYLNGDAEGWGEKTKDEYEYVFNIARWVLNSQPEALNGE